MSRNGSGVYSLPAGSSVANGDTSDASDLNTPLADIEADLNVARPIVAGGTGASSAAGALVNFGLTATAAEINVLDGMTATTAELNTLDGITATTAELNHTDGVTSPIQAQLDGKLSNADGSVTFAKLAGAAVITSGEGLRSNDNDTSIPASATVIDALGPQLQTAQSASGTEIDFTGIPSWVNRVTVMGWGLSTNGTSTYILRIGDGAIVASGYLGAFTTTAAGTPTTNNGATSVGLLLGPTAASVFRFTATIDRASGNTWLISGSGSLSNTNTTSVFASELTLTGALDRVRLTTVIGTDTFDAGSISISWE